MRSKGNRAYLFPGQGSQTVGMGQSVASAYAAAAATFEEADDVLGFALSKLCFEGPDEELTDTINAQPALLVTCIAILRALESEIGATQPAAAGPVYLAGHSLGEYTALVAAGAMTFADGLRLVHARGRLMKAAGAQAPGMMAAILGLDEEQISAVCADVRATGDIVQVANDNCPGQVVISGARSGMETAMAALAKAGARRIVPLAVSIASHSPLMEPAQAQLRAEIDATPIVAPSVPVIANTTATLLTTVEAIRAELTAQLTGRVRWTASIQRALADGVVDFVEVGPGDVLTGMVKRVDRQAKRYNIHDHESVRAFRESLLAT